MVQFIGVSNAANLVRSVGPGAFMAGLVGYLRQDFARWDRFEASARLASHSPNGVIELMPTSDGALYSFKFVNGHPGNTREGKLTVTAFGVLADVATGYPLLLSEMTLATALRTAATSALAASYLARPGSRRMALIGAGAQAEFQALAFHAVLGIDEISVFDVDPRATAKLLRNLAATPSLRVVAAASVADAVRGADIVTTATAAKSRAAVLTPAMVEPGVHINAIGGDCPGKTELDPDVLRQARVVVEYLPQSRVEGEIQQVGEDVRAVELWRIVSGAEPGREAADQVTVFDSVGFALEDFSTLRYLRDLLAESGRARDLDLVPELADPKDLFSLLLPAAAGSRAARVEAAPA